ncbi:integrase, catalytic region, zinc finger, CCHC-type containing protein [Tanacetum coccineum]
MPVLRLDLRCLKEVVIYHGQVILEGTSIEREKIESGLTRQLLKVYMSLKKSFSSDTEEPRMQKEEDLRGDDLKHYEAEIEAMNLILISIPIDIYNSVDACTTAQAMWQRVEHLMRGTVQNKVDRETRFYNEFDQFVAEPGEALVSVYNLRLAKRLTDDTYDNLFDYLQQFEKLVNSSRAKKLEKSHDPLALVVHTGSSSRTTSPYYVTHPSSVIDYDDDYQGDVVQNTFEDPLTSEMILLARQSLNLIEYIFKAGILVTMAEIQDVHMFKRKSLRVPMFRMMLETYRELFELRLQELLQMFNATIAVRKDEAGVTLTDEQNDFLFADASRMEEIKELSANICLMARIQPANFDYDARPSYDYAFLNEHEKERQKCESLLKNVCETSWISKMKKLESENVSLEFQVQSLIKERENVKSEYQKLFDSIKKTRTQTQSEINELIEHVNQKTYAYAEIRAQNQDLLITISELKAKLKKVEKGLSVASSVRRPLNRDSPLKNSVLSDTKKSSEKVEFCIGQSKDVLCVSCAKNVLILCHDKCRANYKLNVHSKVRRALFTTPRTVKSKFKDTTPVVSKTRFSVKTTQSESLDTTSVVSRTKIAAVTLLCARNKVVQIILWIVDSGCSKHMTGDRSLLKNFVEKFMGTVRFGNDHFAAITGYGDYVQGNITVCHVYYVEGLGHNLFSVGQFCDGDQEVAFRSNTCYVRNLEGDDLLTGARESNLYTISISDMAASSPVCLLSKATSTKSWLWHRRLSHLNFGTINDLTKHDLVDSLPKFKYSKDNLCSACQRGKSKKSSHPPKVVPSNHSKLELLHMDLCGPMRVASINGKKYILVIVDDYSRFTWVYFLRIKDET